MQNTTDDLIYHKILWEAFLLALSLEHEMEHHLVWLTAELNSFNPLEGREKQAEITSVCDRNCQSISGKLQLSPISHLSHFYFCSHCCLMQPHPSLQKSGTPAFWLFEQPDTWCVGWVYSFHITAEAKRFAFSWLKQHSVLLSTSGGQNLCWGL